MDIEKPLKRSLGTMVAYGFAEIALNNDLALAKRLGAAVLEIFPDWRGLPDPIALRSNVEEAGLTIHSAHGCWGGQSIAAQRVDLSHPRPQVRRESLDDLRRCVDWLQRAGGRCLVVHPGGLSDPGDAAPRRAALAESLVDLARHARGTGVLLCVENMPPGVHPGSRMADLAGLLAELDETELALALDTGHANISSDVATETFAAGARLRTTHVHDNDGRQDTHLPPGHGNVDWSAWSQALDSAGYHGPIILECVRSLRKNPECIDERFLRRLEQLISVNSMGH